MDGPAADLRIDARNQLCPAPLLMVKKAMRETRRGELIEVVLNDQTSRENVVSLCVERRKEILRSWAEGEDFHLLLRNTEE